MRTDFEKRNSKKSKKIKKFYMDFEKLTNSFETNNKTGVESPLGLCYIKPWYVEFQFLRQ